VRAVEARSFHAVDVGVNASPRDRHRTLTG
jgi:hypothetical protein